MGHTISFLYVLRQLTHPAKPGQRGRIGSSRDPRTPFGNPQQCNYKNHSIPTRLH